MLPLLRSRLRTVVVSCLILAVSFLLLTCHDLPPEYDVRNPLVFAQDFFSKDKANHVSAKSLFDRPDLTEEQCRNTFPLQFVDIDGNLARGPFNFSKSDPDYQGLVQGRIINNTVGTVSLS